MSVAARPVILGTQTDLSPVVDSASVVVKIMFPSSTMSFLSLPELPLPAEDTSPLFPSSSLHKIPGFPSEAREDFYLIPSDNPKLFTGVIFLR